MKCEKCLEEVEPGQCLAWRFSEMVCEGVYSQQPNWRKGCIGRTTNRDVKHLARSGNWGLPWPPALFVDPLSRWASWPRKGKSVTWGYTTSEREGWDLNLHSLTPKFLLRQKWPWPYQNDKQENWGTRSPQHMTSTPLGKSSLFQLLRFIAASIWNRMISCSLLHGGKNLLKVYDEALKVISDDSELGWSSRLVIPDVMILYIMSESLQVLTDCSCVFNIQCCWNA